MANTKTYPCSAIPSKKLYTIKDLAVSGNPRSEVPETTDKLQSQGGVGWFDLSGHGLQRCNPKTLRTVLQTPSSIHRILKLKKSDFFKKSDF
jgi:hypothetical protein